MLASHSPLIHAPGGPPEPLVDTAAPPDQVRVPAARDALALAYADGERRTVSAATLRLSCRCAWCTRARIDGAFAPATDDVRITGVEPMGDYGVRLSFSDGHDRGIFPWAFIAALAAAPLPPSAAPRQPAAIDTRG